MATRFIKMPGEHLITYQINKFYTAALQHDKVLKNNDENFSMTSLNLALQGGGAHGAYTWGVLDRLLEEEDIQFDGLSGTSAGAMNAVMLVSGFLDSGAEGAKAQLDKFWNGIALNHPLEPNVRFWGGSLGNGSYDGASQMVAGLSRWFSPYDLGLGHINPLKTQIESMVDFERINRNSAFKLFIPATEVSTGKIRVFETKELSTEALLASACLPTLHKGVEINGELYWDGGWAGNPVMYPLLEQTQADDILMVLLQPLKHSSLPRRANDISQRSIELGFTASFMREMTSIHRRQQRLKKRRFVFDKLDKRYKNARFHLLEEGEYMETLDGQSKLNIRRSFLEHLKEKGRDAAESWLETRKPMIGRSTSFSLDKYFG